jgi:hypothetical protein
MKLFAYIIAVLMFGVFVSFAITTGITILLTSWWGVFGLIGIILGIYYIVLYFNKPDNDGYGEKMDE